GKMQRFHQEIDTINRVIASFNKYLAPQFPVPRFDQDTAIERKNIVEILHGNWDGFTFPNNRTQGVYFITQGSELLQGDLLRNCPIPRVRGLEHWPLREGQLLEVDIDQEDVVIVSQSCDLANDKIQDVVLAQVLDWSVACSALIRQGNTFARSRNFRWA